MTTHVYTSQRLRDEYADAVDKYFTSYNEATASAYDRTMYHQIAVDCEYQYDDRVRVLA